MKEIKILWITLAVNAVLLPWYALNSLDTVNDFLTMAAIGLREMIAPTCGIVGIYILIKRLFGNTLQNGAGRLILAILILFIAVLLAQTVWSVVVTSGDDTLAHFMGFWGFYAPWTLMACILTPWLDRFYSRREKTGSREKV